MPLPPYYFEIVMAIDKVNNQGTIGTPAATREDKSKGHIVIPYT